jgi:hypothetical protein
MRESEAVIRRLAVAGLVGSYGLMSTSESEIGEVSGEVSECVELRAFRELQAALALTPQEAAAWWQIVLDGRR